ncbi:MAG: PTS glucose transporter subunit IIA [Mycoplasmatales bacterium]
MGIFDKILGKKEIEFLMPLKGEIVDLTETPDEVFSTKMMGDGFAIKPAKDKQVCAPLAGEIVSIFPTNHALGLKTEEGIEILIHVGLDTVNLKGEGFTAHVKAGDKVQAGDLLLEVDFDNIEPKVPSIITPVIFTAIDGYKFEVVKGNKELKEKNVVKITKG